MNLTVSWDFGWTTCSMPKAVIAKPCGSSNLLMRVSSTSSPWWTMMLEGSQILVPSRSTLIKVNCLGSAAVAYPGPSIRMVSRTTNQPSRWLHPWVSCTVMSPLLRHVLHHVVPLSLQRRPPLSLGRSMSESRQAHRQPSLCHHSVVTLPYSFCQHVSPWLSKNFLSYLSSRH